MTVTPRLDAYHFYEREWESYDALQAAFEWEVPETFNIATYVCDRWAAERPASPALYGEEAGGDRERYTFAELDAAASRLANHLAAEGVTRGDRVGVNLPQRPETVVTHVACWKLGAVSVPLSTLFGPDAVGYRLRDAGAVACVVDASNVGSLREARSDTAVETVLTVDAAPEGDERDFHEAIDGHAPAFETVATDAEDDAFLIYTSGTTGNPKGVRHAHRALLGHLPLFLTTFGDCAFADDETYWTPSEWAWIASLFDVVFPGLYYGRPIVAYRGGSFDPAAAFGVVERYGVTNFFAPPTALRMMMQTDPAGFDLASLRVVASGGESLGASVATWAAETFDGAVVHEGYGQTEANMLVGGCSSLFPWKEGYIGRAGPGHEVAIVDPETAEATVPAGEVGEIAVRYEGNPVCFKEYWGKPEKTKGKVRNGWLLTEDLGSMDEEGYLKFESRKDDVIISAGYRIGPTEVEEALATHPAVADAGVIGVPDAERGEVPKAFVVLAAGHEASDDLAAALRTHVRERLAKYEYPRDIEFIDDLPKTSSGKVRRQSLRER
jgi:acetyl-CoA synthetase